jgi:hypothetical protein
MDGAGQEAVSRDESRGGVEKAVAAAGEAGGAVAGLPAEAGAERRRVVEQAVPLLLLRQAGEQQGASPCPRPVPPGIIQA